MGGVVFLQVLCAIQTASSLLIPGFFPGLPGRSEGGFSSPDGPGVEFCWYCDLRQIWL